MGRTGLLAKMLSDVPDVRADGGDCIFEFLWRNAQFFRPVLHFPLFVLVDLVAVLRCACL